MALSEEDKQQVTSLLNETLNGAMANLRRQDEQKRKKDLDDLKESFGKALDEKLLAIKPKEEDPPDPDDKTGGKGKKDREIATLTTKLSQFERDLQASNQRAQQAEARRREVERYGLLDQALSKGGVTDPFMREMAVALFDRRGNAPWSEGEDSRVVWREPSGSEVDFAEGIANWLKSEEAKRFLPATGARGSGSRPTTNNKDLTPAQRDANVRSALAKALDDAL